MAPRISPSSRNLAVRLGIRCDPDTTAGTQDVTRKGALFLEEDKVVTEVSRRSLLGGLVAGGFVSAIPLTSTLAQDGTLVAVEGGSLIHICLKERCFASNLVVIKLCH